MARKASEAIASYNAGREPERLALKYKAMRTNAFRFLRGSCHLFHERMTAGGLAPEGPAAWICGDLHLENFGTYLGDNGLTYFDVNDFDEAVRAPYTWDILRLAASMLVAAPVLGIKAAAANGFARRLVEGYFAELAAGKPRWIERRTATGPIGDLMDGLKKRDDTRFLAKRTQLKGARRAMIVDGVKTLALAKGEREQLAAFLEKVGKGEPEPKAFGLIDAARRIAGTGSLGVARFVLLVEGNGSPDGNWLLDLKSAAPSAVAPFVKAKQPDWPSEAHRVVAVQTLFQANTPGLLSARSFRGGPCLLKAMQPSADRLDLTAVHARGGIAVVVETMAQLTAWGHLRGSGRYGAATGDELIAAAAGKKAARAILERAQEMARITFADYEDYAHAYDAGALAAA